MLAALFAGAADDPGGWSKAKWGMTQAQLSDAFGADLHETFDVHGATDDQGRLRFYLTVDLTVGKIPCQAELHLDKDGHLRAVGVAPVKTSDMTDVLYLDLQDMLVQKYGRPWKSREEMDITNLQWTFATTLITLQRMKLPMTEELHLGNQRIVGLTYERITPASNPL
jgi:hypothetical protein